jgi:hypothetical protein
MWGLGIAMGVIWGLLFVEFLLWYFRLGGLLT